MMSSLFCSEPLNRARSRRLWAELWIDIRIEESSRSEGDKDTHVGGGEEGEGAFSNDRTLEMKICQITG